MLFGDRLFFFIDWEFHACIQCLTKPPPPLSPFQFFFCPHHHSSLPTPCILFFLLNPQSLLGPPVCACVWLIEKIRDRILMSQRLKFKRLLCQTEMNHFSFKSPFQMCMHIHICTGIHLCAYILIHMHACTSRPEVGIQYLPGPFSSWHIETGSLTWTQNSLISSSPWPGCFRNPISASCT